MKKIARIYIDKPETGFVYSLNGNDYVLIDDIPNETEFFCHAIKLDPFGKAYIKNGKAEIVLLEVFVK